MSPISCQSCGTTLTQTFICRGCFPADVTPGSYSGEKEQAWSDDARAKASVFVAGGIVGVLAAFGAILASDRFIGLIHHAIAAQYASGQ